MVSQLMEKGAMDKWGLIRLIVFSRIGAAKPSTTEALATASRCFFLVVESIISRSFVLVIPMPVQAVDHDRI